ncbi:MAG: Ig-like domain-containing protein, partial [Gammaproteobacteria bacterium]|nr:Ig-like domain-containing protein [Gammaproteobacteria bacterium]
SIDGSSSVTITEGDTYQFSGVGSGQLSWSTSNTSLATINSSGRLTSLNNGTVYVYMSDANGNSASRVTVTINSACCGGH